MSRPVPRNIQVFTRDQTTDSIKETLDRILAEYPNVVSVDIKWNANNCTLFVKYIEIRDDDGDGYYDY